MAAMPERVRPKRKSTLSIVDDAALIAVGVVGVLVALKVFGWLVGTMWFFMKLAALIALVYVVGRVVVRSRRR